jgi:tRNA pseudouridine38-40 synthase
MRLKLTIAYDGRLFGGWQSQPNADTIQDRLEAALAVVAKQPLRIHGAGRTDAGVHALAQVAHFDPPPGLAMNPANWVPALNTKLPPTIRVLEAAEVPATFHARFSATGKVYDYRISTRPVLPPLDAGLAWHLPQPLDAEMLESTLARFRGRHDFRAFAATRGNESPATDFHRTLHDLTIDWLPDGPLIRCRGDGFLYKMVRMLVGTAIAVAAGRIPPAETARLLDAPAPGERTRHCAPPDGLTLVAVEYAAPA